MISENSKKITSYILIILSIVFVGIIAISSTYSIMTADDFTHGVLIGVKHVDFISYFKASWSYMIEVYKTWQGTYFSMFLQALLSPANNGELLQLDIEMFISNILLFMSLAFLIFKGLSFKKNDLLIKSIFYFLVVIQITCYIDYYYEIYYWFSGATSYSMPLSLSMFGIAFTLMYIRERKTKYLLLTCICGLCSGGGSLTVAAFGCYCILTVCIYDYLNTKKINKGNLTIFIIWVMSAIINVLGPGNYIRAGVDRGRTISLASGLIGCVLQVLMRCKAILLESPIVFVLLVALVTGHYFGSKENIKNKIITSLVFAFISFVVAFPVALATGGPNVSSRLCFITDFPIYLSSLFLFFTIGSSIKKQINKKMISLILLLVLVASIVLVKPNNIIITTTNLIDGSYYEYKEKYKGILEYVKSEEGSKSDLVIKKQDYPNDLNCFNNLNLSTDSTYWINEGISKFYGINSILREE